MSFETAHQGENGDPGVTSTPLTPAQRKARQRERQRALLYERDDWRLFLDPATLPQKAGCHPNDLRKVVLKELIDNELDVTGSAGLTWEESGKFWIVYGSSEGPLLSEIPTLFCVNRPLASSKLKRMPTRGMLGNGLRVVMGAVHALGGWIIIEARNHNLELQVDPADGSTKVIWKTPLSQDKRGYGMRVLINLGKGTGPDDAILAQEAIYAADKATVAYQGPSSPWWYGVKDLQILFQAAPAGTTVSEVAADLGLELQDDRQGKTLEREQVEKVLSVLRANYNPVPPDKLGRLGEYAYGYEGYACKLGQVQTSAGALIPYVIEAWANANKPEKKGGCEASVLLFVNRTRTIAHLYGFADVGGIRLRGCGINRAIELKNAAYTTVVSIVTPYIQLAGDGKEPVLAPVGNAIEEALKRACNAAYRNMDKPDSGLSIKDAAYRVMQQAYLKASGNGKYPANARQIMYAARPLILELTGRESLDDKYFTQTLLPDFMEDNAELTANWSVAYDARGHFIEPHTYREIGLGTLEVDGYLETEAEIGPAVKLGGSEMYPTHGPLNRYETILFIEKEGFMPLLESARIAERFDLGIMSTKGMSVVACRKLLDELSASGHLKQVLVLHDFDVYGFSIFGTLGTDTRRYTFSSEVTVVDLGLRLADIEELELEGEPYSPKDWDARELTLERHGATEEEIEFLEEKRVELNALTAPQFVEFLETKLALHTAKVVPDQSVIEAHARRIWEQQQAKERCKEILAQVHAEAASAHLPEDLVDGVHDLVEEDDTLSWDQAVAKLMKDFLIDN
jgi:hypothetical protein